MVVDGGGGSVCCYCGGGGRGGVCVRCLLSCRREEESHERVCRDLIVKLRCPPRQQVNFGIAVSPASERFCSVAALLAAAAAAPRSRWR